ncbi:MAG TPA: hypothetical protein VGK56_09155 [Anaerolineales bacterium]
MLARRVPFNFIGIAALLFSALACRAATQLVLLATPTPTPSQTPTITPTLTPTFTPTFTPTVIFEAACPTLIAGILNDITSDVGLPGERADERFRGEGSIFLVTYEVTGDKLSGTQIQTVPDELEDERDDRLTHEAIWDYFKALIPAEERARVSEFSIFTDGRGSHLAAVSPTFSDPERWTLHVDIEDAESYYDLTYTLIHEQGHLLTLNSEQVPLSKAILRYPNNSTIYNQEVAACPQYFTGEGCSQPDSYINQFFNRFWPYLYAEWEQIDLEEDDDIRQILLEEFYEMFQDQFLTGYAATSPAEDIAEAWTFFVLSPKPELTSIASEKILFFYEYPELVELRTQILNQICAEFPR